MTGLPGDTVPDLDPIEFAVRFTRAMRSNTLVHYPPSLRTSLAIPRWLTARHLRTGHTSPNDYIRAAVLCTPHEDQRVADRVARSILFPEERAAKAKTEPDPVCADDAMSEILGDLASLDVDFDALEDFSELEDMFEEEDLGAFDLFETLYSSADPVDRALGELIHAYGGGAALEAGGLRTRPLAELWVVRMLLTEAGDLPPQRIKDGVAAGFATELHRAVKTPWETAAVLAATADPTLSDLLHDALHEGSATTSGRILYHLGPFPDQADARQSFADASLSAALDLTEFAELVIGMQSWVEPDTELIEASVAAHPRRALDAAGRLAQHMGEDRREVVFATWLRDHHRADLGLLATMATPCPSWQTALTEGLEVELDRLTIPVPAADAPIDRLFDDAVRVAAALKRTQLPAGIEMASTFATELLVHTPIAPWFLPLLDQVIEHGVRPELEPVLARARELGIPDEEVLDRLGEALSQLITMVLGDMEDPDRYSMLVDRIQHISPETLEQLCTAAEQYANLQAMAALLAIDLGGAAERLSDASVEDALGHKGIGGGTNLLKQWFSASSRLHGPLRDTIKARAKAVLLEEALAWSGQGGSGEQGIVPQNQTRPFRAGDALDGLDLEGTLDAIIASGRTLDEVREEDLFVHETSRGRAAITFLLDISGSMGGGELAMCAIAVVMVLGRLLPEEVALAVFESNTHVLKTFVDVADLDQVADDVLDLVANGGTCADAALSWAAHQFDDVPAADIRALFLLSDFAFVEGEETIRLRCAELAERGVELIAFSHGWVQRDVRTQMVAALSGSIAEVRTMHELPRLLLDCLTSLGDGR